MSAAFARPTSATPGAKTQMNGSVSKPIRAVKTSRTATSLSLKYL